ncbi:MAG: fatty acid--CoA ligase family protein [Acidimicrobiaceae bacterium]|nr:fatty acid--CoA ligase family protein [Acidimicrobiaceae bacterium]
MSLLRLLVEHPSSSEDPLVHTLDRSLTKGEVLAAVEARAGDFSGLRGQLSPVVADGVEALIAMFACFRAGAVYVPINPRQPQAAVDDITRAMPEVASPPDAAFVLWTSGTTGRPKPVVHTHDGYIEIIDRVLEPLRAKPKDPARPPSPNLIPVSMALNAGIYNALFGLRAGARLVMMDGFDTAAFAMLVKRHQIRSTVLPPAAIAMLSDDASIESLAPLRYVRSITAPLSPFQARRFTDRFGVTVLNGYGQAEVGEVIGWTADDARMHPGKLGAIGRPHPGVAIDIDDPDSDGVGELLVKPPSTAADLDPRRLTAGGFVRTGDLARIDGDGFVWLEGRLSDLINRGGHKVFPSEVEEVLVAVPGIREAAVVGAPDSRLGEVPVAFVVGETDSDLGEVCRQHLVAYKVPVRFEFLDRLPRSETGKVLRRELVAQP